MSERSSSLYEYECDGCHGRFEVLMTFREHQPFDRDEQGKWHPTGYPELQPECPHCHSHDVVQVTTRELDGAE
jgi:hypothetical protein